MEEPSSSYCAKVPSPSVAKNSTIRWLRSVPLVLVSLTASGLLFSAYIGTIALAFTNSGSFQSGAS